ncbi:MAG TPA: SGNH/GDSL hydrolase family protein [Caldimonas sp.]
MKSKSDRWRLVLWSGALLASALAACGGGSLVQAFAPNRVIAFGDESSVIDDFKGDANGRKYTVNATVSATDQTLACKLDPIWIQVLANAYALVFPQCNPAPNAVIAPSSRIRAAAGAMVADIAAQVDAQVAETVFTPKDLVTMLAGQNDILAQYAQYPGVGEAQLTANLQAAGAALAGQVNRLANTGAKVLISTVPDLGLTPFAFAERAANTDTDRSALLTRLTKSFNDKLRANIINDGRMIGLILTDEYFQGVTLVVNGGGFTNAISAACDLTRSALVPPSALDCTPQTLIAGGSATAFLWADTLHLSPGGHQALGSLALTRTQNNPF